MPPAIAPIDYSWHDKETFVKATSFDRRYVPVTDRRRSTAFYSRLFGLHPAVGAVSGEHGLLSGREDRLRLVLREVAAGTAARLLPVELRVEVATLESAREVVWNLGIPAADTPNPCRNRSFSIRDPDGHVIRFVTGA